MSTDETNPKDTIDTSPSLPHSFSDPLLNDTDKWPDLVSGAPRVGIAKRGPHQGVTSFPTTQQKNVFHLPILITSVFCVTEKLLFGHG